MHLLEGRLDRCEFKKRAGHIGRRVLRVKGEGHQLVTHVDECLLVGHPRRIVRSVDLDRVLPGRESR
jgi:hypothetical protein